MNQLYRATLISLGLMCILFSSPVNSSGKEQQRPVDNLVGQFIEAFNSANADTMAEFYQHSATSSFKQRRTEQEDRALHQRLLQMLGTLTFQQLEIQDAGNAKLSVLASATDSSNEIRFKLVGEPPQIDGFSVGVPPKEEEQELYSDKQTGSEHELPDGTDQSGPFNFLTSVKGVYQTQLSVQSDGSLLLVWVQRGLYDLDLFVARQEQDAEFSHPLRVNHRGLNRFTGDEARPDVALGPNGEVAITWTAANNSVMIAVGSNFGLTFDPPLKLNQDDSRAYRTMPTVAFSPDGAAHAVWLDPRQAPKGMEEPSDLYYAVVKNGNVIETNLTADQEQTVCGCCRPYIAINEEGVFDIAFRNEDLNGYRDISRIYGSADTLSAPQATSPPIWKLNACPSAGPIVRQGGTLWKDASTGDWRLLWSTNAKAEPTELFTNQHDMNLTRSPRTVSGRESWVLVGANPNSVITELVNDSWVIVQDKLPPWVSSATVTGDKLIMIGNKKGLLLTSVQHLQ